MTFRDFGYEAGGAVLEKVAVDSVKIVAKAPPKDGDFYTLAQRSADVDRRQAAAEEAERKAATRASNFDKAQQKARRIIKDERALNRAQIEESNLLRNAMQREGLNAGQVNEFFHNYGDYKRRAEQGEKELEKLRGLLSEKEEAARAAKMLSSEGLAKVFTPKRLAIGGGAALAGGAGLYGLHHLMKHKGDYEFLNN